MAETKSRSEQFGIVVHLHWLQLSGRDAELDLLTGGKTKVAKCDVRVGFSIPAANRILKPRAPTNFLFAQDQACRPALAIIKSCRGRRQDHYISRTAWGLNKTCRHIHEPTSGLCPRHICATKGEGDDGSRGNPMFHARFLFVVGMGRCRTWRAPRSTAQSRLSFQIALPTIMVRSSGGRTLSGCVVLSGLSLRMIQA